MQKPIKPAEGRSCRFCAATPVTKTYLAAPHPVSLGKLTILVADIEWDACSTCADLIDQRRWEELNQHVFQSRLKALKAKGTILDFEQQDRLRQSISEAHQVIREAMGRTA